jgi:hypothetical protein
MSECLKCAFRRFTQHTLSLLRILATDVQPITVDVYGRSKYRSCSTAMSASSISLWRDFVPHREHRLNNKERLRAGRWCHKCTQVYVQTVCYFWSFAPNTATYRQNLLKIPNTKFHQNLRLEWHCSLPPFGRTDMTELRWLCERSYKRTELVVSVLRFTQRCIRGSKCSVSVGWCRPIFRRILLSSSSYVKENS